MAESTLSVTKKPFSLRLGTVSERSVKLKRERATVISHFERENSSASLASPKLTIVETKTFSATIDELCDKPHQFYQKALQLIFTSLKFTKQQKKRCLMNIDSVMTARQHKAIQNQTFLPTTATNEIKKLQTEVDRVLVQQKEAAAATKIQSLVRGYLIRKKYLQYTPESKKELKLWTTSFSQVLSLEQRYTEKLSALIHYLEPFNVSNNCVSGTENTAHYLQNNFQQLLKMHEALLANLEELNDSPGFPFSANLGERIQENVTNLIPAYTKFIKNYRASLEVVDYFRNNIPQFQDYLDEIAKNRHLGYKKLKNLLQLPAKHLVTLGKLLTTIYEHYTGHDKVQLCRAISTLGFSSDTMQTQISQQALPATLSNIRKILAVEYQLEPLAKPLNLLAGLPNRTFLKEGPLKVNGKKNMQICLFSDLLVISEKTVNALRFVNTVELHHAQLSDVSEKDFTVTAGEQTTVCHCSSRSETADWVSRITSIIDNYSKHRVYGIPLQELLAREKQADGIPIILKNMFGWIAKNSCDVEGIFRVPGDSSIIEEYKLLYDCGMEKEIDFSLCSAHDVAGLCKLYLRELPEPLVPYELYETVIDIEHERAKHNDQDASSIEKVAEIIRNVPVTQRKVLQFVLNFLKEYSVHAKKTKMTVDNLAMVFSPNLIRPLVNSIDTAMKSPIVTQFVVFLIDNHEEIWGCESIVTQEELDADSVVKGLLQQDTVSLDDLKAIKKAKPSQYIELSQSAGNPKIREPPAPVRVNKKYQSLKISPFLPRKAKEKKPINVVLNEMHRTRATTLGS